MFVKYTMNFPGDYRGNVRIVKRDIETEDDVAYTSVDVIEPGMTELTPAEKLEIERATGGEWLTERQEYQRQLDVKADDIRRSYLYNGPYTVVEEYSQVEKVTLAWEAAGKPMDAVPPEISVWADIKQRSIDWAYNDIKQATFFYRSMLTGVRELRLRGKEAMKLLPANQLKEHLEAYMEQLEQLRCPPEY